jgi:dihydroorotate dehydrogenase (fumarate)
MDLTTTYLGLKLRTPLVPSASPLSEDLDKVKKMEQAGASAVVLHSLFEEEIEAVPPECRVGPTTYLEHIRRAKSDVKIPIIASLNCTTVGGWISYARQITEAGADAIELNISHWPGAQ